MQNSGKYTVYMHTLPNGKCYIGLTKQNPVLRWDYGHGYKHNEYFYRAIQKYGWNNIKHEILFTDLTKDEAEEKEIALIAQFKSNKRGYGYNIDAGGFHSDKKFKAETNLPPFDEVLRNRSYMKLFSDLLKICVPQKVIETVTVENYIGDTLIKREVKETERVIEPNLSVVNEIIDAYETEPQIADLISKLKRVREKYDD